MSDLSGRKPILCLDFDGVCHSYTSGWKGADVIPDDPVPGLFEFLADAVQDFEVNIFSSRTAQPKGLTAMKTWFRHRYCEWHMEHFPGDTKEIAWDQAVCMVAKVWKFPKYKPASVVGLDDRVLTFNGTWPSIDELKAFKPWNKLKPSIGNGKVKRTARGFALLEFKDYNGVVCSLQESSLATEHCIWFGCNKAHPVHLVPGEGWKPVDMPNEYVANTRMHLTRKQVADLLPHLARFVETGEL